MQGDFLIVFFALLVGHALADYPLQGDFLAKAKNRFAPMPGVPWPWAMGAHCMIHAGFVYLLTGWWYLALTEFILHWGIDEAKCGGHISFSQDQIAHVACKTVYAFLVAYVVGLAL